MSKLREETAELHKKAEQMPFNTRMMNGELTNEEYGQYLVNMKGIFSTLESNEPLHEGLPRVASIDRDIDELGLDEVPEMTEKATKYVDYLKTLSHTDVWAHMYLHYLALLYGGQMIKKNVPVTSMYEFDGNVSEMIESIRSKQMMYEEMWIPEVNAGYEMMIKMFDELGDDNDGE